MSCAEGQRLSTQFLQSAMATRSLKSQEASASIEERRERKQEIEQVRQLEERCRREVTDHAQSCPMCGSGSESEQVA